MLQWTNNVKIGQIWDLCSLSQGYSADCSHILMFLYLLLQLKHPNVVKYYKTFLEGEYDFLLCVLVLSLGLGPKSCQRLIQATGCTC